MAMKMVPGKVYLRDIRNGQVYEYEANLAGMSYIQAFTQEDESNAKKAKAEAEVVDGGGQNADTTPDTPPRTEPAVQDTTPVREQAEQAAAAAQAKAPTAPEKPAVPKPPVAKVATKVAAKKVVAKKPLVKPKK